MLAPITASGAGDTTIVPAVAGKRIRVRKVVIINQVATAQAVKLRHAATDFHAAINLPLVIGGPGITVDSLVGDELLTAAGELLAINLSAATAVTGYVVYALD